MRIIVALLLLFALPAFGQRFVDEVENIASLQNRNVGNLNKSVFVRSSDGGLFVITNSSILVDGIFRIGSSNNPAWSYDRRFSGPIDFRWAGAVGDGTPGDNAKIAAVFSAAAARGYAVFVSNLTGSDTTNQFELSLSPPNLLANQKYLQIGAAGGLRIYTDPSSNFVYAINGIVYSFPTSQGATNTALVNDGTGTLSWQVLPSGGGGTNLAYLFGDQFQTNGNLVALADPLSMTNAVFKRRVRAPNVDVPGINIDASTGTEFSKILASNTTLGILNMTNDQTIHFTVTNTTFTLGFTNANLTWTSGVTPVIDTNWVNVFHFTMKGGWIYASDPEQKANANIAALASISGNGVLVKTNSTFSTFYPLPIGLGGTGTNFFSTFADGNVIFYNKTLDRMDADDSQFLYSKPNHSLFLARTTPTGAPQLSVVESSGVVPLLELYSNALKQNNDDFSLDNSSGSNLLFKINGTTALKVSQDKSVIAGGGSTNTSRTNQFFYLPISGGPPTGTPVTETGHLPMVFDTVNTNLYFYVNGAWALITGTNINDNWFALGTTNSQLNGNAFVNQITSTNGFFSVGAIYGPTSAGPRNNGGAVQVQNLSPSVGSSLQVKGGAVGNVQSWVELFGGNVSILKASTNSSIVVGDGTTTSNRTTKFLYIPTTAGPPTGTPATETTGTIPMVLDTVNTAMMVYNGGTWQNIGGTGGGATNVVGGNPTAEVGLTAINGSATNYMRSDAAPKLSQAISPEWAGQHIFDRGIVVGTHTPTNLGGLYPTSMTNGLVFTSFFDRSQGDPGQASISYAVAKDLSVGTPEQSSFTSLISSSNSFIYLTSQMTNGTVSQLALTVTTNGSSITTSVAGTNWLSILPSQSNDGTAPYQFNNRISHTTGNVIEAKTGPSTTNFTIKAVNGYSGKGTNVLTDDGTYKTTPGSLVASNYYAKSNGTNLVSSTTSEVPNANAPGGVVVNTAGTINPQAIEPFIDDIFLTSLDWVIGVDSSFLTLHSDDPVAAHRNFKIPTNGIPNNMELQLRWTGTNAGLLDLSDTSNYKYIVATNWIPTDGNILHLRFDATNTAWREEWRYPPLATGTSGGGGSTNGANWIALGTTNSILNGNATVNQITSTNGFKTGQATYGPLSAGMVNNGGPVLVQQLSTTANSSLTLDSGNALTSWILMRAGNTNRMLVGSNGVVQMFYGASADNLLVTNALNIGVGTSGGTARVGGTVFVYKTPTGNIGGGVDDLMTYAVVANQLAVDNDRLEIRCSGQWAGNANNKEVKAVFGTQQIFATGGGNYNGGDWVMTIEIIRDNPNGQIVNVTWNSGNSQLRSSSAVTFPSEDMATTVIFKLTGAGVNNNDVLQRTETVTFYPAP